MAVMTLLTQNEARLLRLDDHRSGVQPASRWLYRAVDGRKPSWRSMPSAAQAPVAKQACSR
jgi:hypothetical protein